HKNENYQLTPATSLSIMKTAKSDILHSISQIQKTINIFSQNLNPKGFNGNKDYKILTGFNDGENTQNRLTNVINNGLMGLLIIFIVFFLFLPSRIGFMVSWSLPLSLFGTFAILPFMDVSFNVITMLAFVICIGMLIDNSVVIAEYYSRLVMEHKKTPFQAALESTQQFVKPITATILTTIVAFLPLLVTTGVMGQFVKWIPIVVTLALIMSLFESFYLLPNRLTWLSQKKPNPYQTNILNTLSYIENLFEKLIKNIVARKYISVGAIAILISSTILIFLFASRLDLFAPKSPEFYAALIEPQPNTPLEIIDKKSQKIAEQMQSVFGGKKQIDWMSVESNTENAAILLRVKPSMRRKLNYIDTLNQLREIKKEDLKTLRFSTVVGGPPVGKPLKVVIQSNNRKEIRKFINKISPEIEKIPGLINVKSNPDRDQGVEYQVNTDTEILARLGIHFSSVGTTLRTALEGHIITELTENNESFYVRIKNDDTKISSAGLKPLEASHLSSEVKSLLRSKKSKPVGLSSFEDLKKLKIKTFTGQLIPLDKVAEIKKVPSEPHRKSYNFEPVIFLEADINPKITTSLKVNKQAKKIIEQKIKDHPSLTFKMIGEQETTAESLNSLLNAALIAVFAIFIILIVLFKSFLLSFLILTCIPLGLIGVIWAFFLHQRPLDFFAMIGIIALAGVVVNSAIILVSFILKLKRENLNSSLSEIVVKASKMRFRPIIITNLTTLGGLFPTAYAISGFEPLLIPMTLALFWGLLTATLLTLIWIPCAILIIKDGEHFITTLKQKYKKRFVLN
ncbi:MAG: efflux RND transporter permease subunit, partial [Oligoflexia bacterium]|nr:efflux RND transporter permease subunit [Oligoflexia bacterium]